MRFSFVGEAMVTRDPSSTGSTAPLQAVIFDYGVVFRAAMHRALVPVAGDAAGWTERIRARGLADLFDDVVVSGDVGLAKPDPAVFRLAADRLGVAPEACLMIDDQPQHLAGAETTGMRIQLFEKNGLAALVARLEAEGALG